MHFFLIVILSSATYAAEVIDKIVAIVGDQPILQSEINASHETLDQFIDDVLIEQEIKKLHLNVSESELQDTIHNIMEQNHLDKNGFQAALALQGMSLKSYEESLKKQMHKARLIQNKVKSRVPHTTRSKTMLSLDQAHFSNLEEASQAIENDELSFQDIGTLSQEALIKPISQAASLLKEGQISKPIQIKNTYVVIRLKKRFEIPLEEVDKIGYEKALDSAFERYVKEIRASAYIERK